MHLGFYFHLDFLHITRSKRNTPSIIECNFTSWTTGNDESVVIYIVAEAIIAEQYRRLGYYII